MKTNKFELSVGSIVNPKGLKFPFGTVLCVDYEPRYQTTTITVRWFDGQLGEYFPEHLELIQFS